MLSNFAAKALLRPRSALLLNQLVFSQLRSFAIIRRYTPDHEWIEFNTDTREAKIGITHYAQSELGDIVHLELPGVGTEFIKNDGIVGIESVKTAADVYAPVSGEVIALNENAIKDPALVNNEAESDGWMIKVHVSTEGDLEDLMDEKAYKKFVEEENKNHK